jgi:23S rRNA (pseudouridine1915-N3)-methyltransferase
VKIRVVSVGRERPGDFTALAVADYAERIARAAQLELVELPAKDGPAAKDKEAEAILAVHTRASARGRAELWALDERGEEMTSLQLAERMRKLRDDATDLHLVVGGDEGLGAAVLSAARFRWSLSRLTLPHRLARVVVLEQLYRSFEILRGRPYHK